MTKKELLNNEEFIKAPLDATISINVEDIDEDFYRDLDPCYSESRNTLIL